MISLFNDIAEVFDYIKNFTWDDNKFHRGRSLVEIAGLISEVSFKYQYCFCIENENY